jgi:hypothetical protein
MRTPLPLAALLLSIVTCAAQAQQSPAGATVVTSQPGRVEAAQVIKASVVVIAIDPAKRGLTLKAANGQVFDIVAGPEVRNFDQIKVNDRVVAEYVRALTLELRKGGGVRESAQSTDAARTKPGEKPGVAVGGQMTVVADVVDVNKKNKTISLRGPKGNVLVLDVQNPDQFKVVKKGDQVEADYSEALALSVQPATK